MRTRTRTTVKKKFVVLMLSVCAVLISVLVSADRSQTPGLNGPCRPQGATRGCSAKGKPGQQTCDGGVWTVCVANPPPPPAPVTGTVTPKYLILTVIYAPPGTNGGKSSSSINYGSSSTLGSTVSSSDGFKISDNVSVTASQGVLGSTQAGVSFGYTNNSSNTHTTDIKKTASSEINLAGPGIDGINHDEDEIWLLRRPTVQVTLFPSGSNAVSRVTWRLEDTKQTPMYVYVKWLKHPEELPTGVLNDLQAAGITPADYPEIQQADPFANQSLRSVIRRIDGLDPNRFQLVAGFPYEPPADAGGPVPLQKYTISQTNTQTNGKTVQDETTVGLSTQGGADFPGLFNLAIKNQTNWTWTSTDTTLSSTGTTESASLTIGGPAFGYQGPIDVAVYYDVIFRTFLFTFLPSDSSPILQGLVEDSSGRPVSHKEMVVRASGVTYRTSTNAKGQYRIFRQLTGPIHIQVAGVTKDVAQMPTSRKFDIVLSR